LFLSHATINRFGGTLSLHSSPQGTTTEIVLPRADQKPAQE
jgi:two-component system sensor histidine kinase RegB